ncbi:MAG: response regulator [Treponema sp.]|jgi:YesN/AraC family two-component response regulator|nr:response regulator [Treponema sp.]
MENAPRYKVLFVDDEPWVIIDILYSIPWERLGFEVIGHYEKPRKAKEAILTGKPHLAFVDINMPVMNGFELIRQCREEGSDTAFVILSAYSDFEFAKQAIRAAVLDYCLKPVNPGTMVKMLEEIKCRLHEKEAAGREEGEAGKEGSGGPAYVPENEERFNRILSYIKSNYQKKLSLPGLAEQFAFNKNYICYLFKKFTGGTFSHYIINLRIEKSKRLLETTSFPLRVIAEETGFADTYYFSRVFKSVCGVPPHTYRLRKGETGGV